MKANNEMNGNNMKDINMQHTPGPWTIDETVGVNSKPVYLIEDASGDSIAQTRDRTIARLIAAAPELLESLQRLLEERYVCGESDEFDASGNWTCNSPASVAARAAIAKATA